MPLYLIFLFFVTAALYASVGFGGGSTYNALLVLSGVDYRMNILPKKLKAGGYESYAIGKWHGTAPRPQIRPAV